MFCRNLLIAGFVACFVFVIAPVQAAMVSPEQGHGQQRSKHKDGGYEEKSDDLWIYELNKGVKGLDFKQYDHKRTGFFDFGRDFVKDRDHRFGFMNILGHFSHRGHDRDGFWHHMGWYKYQKDQGDCPPPASVPLPAALPLFGLGLAGLAVIRNRRNQGR